MNHTATILATLALAVSPLLVSAPANAQDWPMPPSSVELSHVSTARWRWAGTSEGHRYGLPVYMTFPRIGIIRNVTCADDATGACEAAWTRFYRSLAAFRDGQVAPLPAVKTPPRRTPERNV